MIPELKLVKHPVTGKIIPEEWRDINEFIGVFQVSNYGRIKSLHRLTKNGQGFRPVMDRIRSLNYSKKLGYWQVTLKNKAYGKHKRYYVHRLVAEHFIENPDNKPEVNHLDGDKRNAFYLNLEWSTGTDNLLHAHRIGLKHGYWKGKVIHNAKPVLAIQESAIIEFPSATHCATHLNVCLNSVLSRIDKLKPIKNHLIYSL